MYSNLKVILFDLGRVLMHIDFDAFPKSLGLFTKEQKEKYDDIQIRNAIIQYETGKLSTPEFQDKLHESFCGNFSREEVINAYNAIIVKDNIEIIPFVELCKSKYQIAILSNTSPSHWEKVLRISSVVKLFTHSFTSFQLGVMKPDAAVYKKVCSTFNVSPNEVLFIDDLQENIEGARNVGMMGLVYHNQKQFMQEFNLQEIALKVVS